MTPTCKTCSTKFPGRDICKHCGADPNAQPTVGQRIARKLKVKSSRATKVDCSAQRAYIRSIVSTRDKRRKKHGRQVSTR